jgi:hypothetical protein
MQKRKSSKILASRMILTNRSHINRASKYLEVGVEPVDINPVDKEEKKKILKIL